MSIFIRLAFAGASGKVFAPWLRSLPGKECVET